MSHEPFCDGGDAVTGIRRPGNIELTVGSAIAFEMDNFTAVKDANGRARTIGFVVVLEERIDARREVTGSQQDKGRDQGNHSVSFLRYPIPKYERE